MASFVLQCSAFCRVRAFILLAMVNDPRCPQVWDRNFLHYASNVLPLEPSCLLRSASCAAHKSRFTISSITLQTFSHWSHVLSQALKNTSFQRFALCFMSKYGQCRCAYLSMEIQEVCRYSHTLSTAPEGVTGPEIWTRREEWHIKRIVFFQLLLDKTSSLL